MNRKMQQAIKLGKLIKFKDILNKLPFKQSEEIEQRARYIRTAMVVKKLRKKLKLTQQELADKMNTKRELISRVESGRQNITLETLHQIAEATDKDLVFQFK